MPLVGSSSGTGAGVYREKAPPAPVSPPSTHRFKKTLRPAHTPDRYPYFSVSKIPGKYKKVHRGGKA